MRCVSLLTSAGLAAFWVLSAAVNAQDEPLTQQQPVIDELSELDRLSQAKDDPFASDTDEAKRVPLSVTLRALNKITARNTDIEIRMNEIARFGSLEIQPRTCDKRPPEEFPETTAFLEIFDLEFNSRQSDLKIQAPEVIEDEIETRDLAVLPGEAVGDRPTVAAPAPVVLDGPQAEGVNIFRGWMFASTPALNELEHPVYDVWVIDCKTQAASN